MIIGLGGGSSIDTAKSIAIMHVMMAIIGNMLKEVPARGFLTAKHCPS